MAVAAMGAGDVIVVIERGHHAVGYGLLPNVSMECSIEAILAAHEEVLHGGFPLAAGVHPLIDGQQLLLGKTGQNLRSPSASRDLLRRQEFDGISGLPARIAPRSGCSKRDGFVPLS